MDSIKMTIYRMHLMNLIDGKAATNAIRHREDELASSKGV